MVEYTAKDGIIREFLEARRGNSTYARKTAKQLAEKKEKFLHGVLDNSVMFITLAGSYGSSYNECKASWQKMPNAIGLFTKSLVRNKEVIKYMVVLEATEKGCCHAHLLFVWNRPLEVKEDRTLADRKLLSSIREKWLKAWMKVSDRDLKKNTISVQVCPNKSEAERTFDYIIKYLGMSSSIEKSLIAARDNKASTHDLKKLFNNYWGFKLRKKLFRFSKNL